MASILSLGVHSSRIIYSHTRKQVSSLDFASRNGIDLMTFDDEDELRKIKRVFPKSRLLLRFAQYDATAKLPMGIKFGCQREDCVSLLRTAKDLQLNVVGTHFHVGTGSETPSTYHKAITFSRELFDAAESFGFNFNILDIGGGFPGVPLTTGKFQKHAEAINDGLAEHFPEGCNVDVIAEPGTYFMKSAVTVVAKIIGKRKRFDNVPKGISSIQPNGLLAQNLFNGPVISDNERHIHYDYYLNDGVYTSLNNHLIETPTAPDPLEEPKERRRYTGDIYGNSCCEIDVIMRNCSIPEMNEGDWVFFEDKGDYSHTVTNFNGFRRPLCYYAIPDNYSRILRGIIGGNTTMQNNDNGNVSRTLVPGDVFQLLGDS